MNLLQKVARRGTMLMSQTLMPKGRRAVRHVKLPDFEMLVLANEDVGRQILLFKDFEPDETCYFNSILKPDDICFDIGGNVGYFSLLMARKASGGQVHIFEPIPMNAALIRTNAELNDFKNMEINNVAVGAEKGSVLFSVSVDSAYSSMHATGRLAEQKTITVPLLTIDDYLADKGIARIDIMKVDVEGAEDIVIQGAARILSDAERRPRMVLLELFDENLKPFGSDVLSIVKKMQAFGYLPHVLASSGGELIPFDAAMANKFYNVIFTT